MRRVGAPESNLDIFHSKLIFLSLSSVCLDDKKDTDKSPLLKAPAPPTWLKIHKMYWIGVEIPKHMQFDQAGIKSVIVLVNKGRWRCGSITLTPAY